MRSGRSYSATLTLLVAPLVLSAQVRFERDSTWVSVQSKARAEGKHVLALVCSGEESCDEMDTTVFADDAVAALASARFVAVKVDGDTALARRYKISGYPVTLFFGPDGKVVHRGVGLRNAAGFLALMRESLDPTTQYYVQLDAYERGERNYAAMMALARTARQSNENELARRIARDYIEHLQPEQRFTQEHIAFIARFTERSTDPGFAMFLQPGKGDSVDRVMRRPRYAERIADRVITAEEITPSVFPGRRPSVTAPDWSALIAAISKKYGDAYAARMVLDAQIAWTSATKRGPELLGHSLAKLDRYGPHLEPGELNDLSWNLFLHSDDPVVLTKGIAAMERVARDVESNPSVAGFMAPAFIDTYANLLYRAGRTAEAITWEEKAVKLTPPGSLWWNAHTTALAKMQKGERTWP